MVPVLYIGIAQGLFIFLFFLLREPRRPGDTIVSVLMIFLSFPLIAQIVMMRVGPSDSVYARFFINAGYPLTYGPILLYYVKMMTGRLERFKWKDALHCIPFAVFTAAAAAVPPLPHPVEGAEGFPFTGYAAVLSFIAYSAVILTSLRRHGKRIDNYFSSHNSRITLHWLFWITGCFVLAYAFAIMADAGVVPFSGRGEPLERHLAKFAGITFFIYVFAFFALNQPVIFKDEAAEEAPDKKYEKSGLKDDDAVKYLAMLEDYMKTEKPYLEGDLTLTDVSEKLGIPKHHITQIINELLNKNFYAYINEYRVNEAIQRMTDLSYAEHTVLRIAFDSGFNSKSAFNAIFKKHTSCAPSQYRKRYGSGD